MSALMVQVSSLNCGAFPVPRIRRLAMESEDLVCRLQAAVAGDRVLQQEIAMSLAVEKELQRNARVHCSAVVDQYLAEKRVATFEALPGSASSMGSVDARDHERAYEQASSMMNDFFAERSARWTAQMRALLQVSALRQEQRLRLKQLQEFTITIPLEHEQQEQPPEDPRCRWHQQQQPPQYYEQQHEPGSASASAAPQQTARTNLATPKGKGSAAIRRERARLAEELGIKPKGTLNRQRKECKKRRDLKYKQAAAAAARQRHCQQWQQPNKGGNDQGDGLL